MLLLKRGGGGGGVTFVKKKMEKMEHLKMEFIFYFRTNKTDFTGP